VSPKVNIYALKVLNSDGEGQDSDIVEALDYVLSVASSKSSRAIVSMSLGESCV
jgi:hypothetical protein